MAILGIDLGTTFSAMATIEGGEPKIVENTEGERTTASVVAISKNGERLVGSVARRQAVTNPQNTVYSVKRLIGHKFKDSEVQDAKGSLSYELRESDKGGVEIKMGEKWYRPEEISSMILQKLKRDAEEKLGEKVEEAVITCPAYFDDSQRKATKDAGEIAGLKVTRIINEPTAAALSYGFQKNKDEKIAVYDFGGGTFDISVLNVSSETIEVKATGGNNRLGGDDFDQKIINWVVDNFKKDEGIDLSQDSLALQRIKEAAEKAKKELSNTMQTEINLPFISSGEEGPKHLAYTLERSKLEELVSDYVDESIKHTKETIERAGLNVSDINEIILVGGQTRMPKIQEEIKNVFGKEPNKEINPDEVVAIGAAVQAGIMKGEMKEVLLLDVAPLSLGIETLGGVNTVLIPKDTTIPTSKTQTFSTAADNQTSVEIKVLQGERPTAEDCKVLGRFVLEGIPPAPRGVPQIEVTFDIDANGILNVSAKDKSSGKEQSIRIEAQSGLSQEEIDRMQKEAEEHAEEDKKKRELLSARNNADSLIYTAEKSLRESGDKISDDLKKEIEDKVNELKKVKEGEDTEEIKNKTQELSTSVQKVGTQMYEQSQGGESGAQEGESQEGQEGQEGQEDQSQQEDKKEGEDGDTEEGEYKDKS